MDYWSISLLVIGGTVCVCLFFTRNFDYFEKLGIPHVKPVPLFGNMAGIVFGQNSMPEVVRRSYDCHPDAKYVGFYDFSVPVILLKDPELVKSIGIKNFDMFPDHRMFAGSPIDPFFDKNLFALRDDEWRDMRAILSPAFTPSKMKMMFETLSQCAKNFVDHLANQNPKYEELNTKEAFERYTLDVIAAAAFGLGANSMRDRDNEFYRMGKSAADFSVFNIFKFFLLRTFPWLGTIFGMKMVSRKTSNFLTNAIRTTIADREAQGIVKPDMIQQMMQAKDKDGKYALSLEDMTAQSFIFFVGGFDTPSSMMSFAAFELALNPDCQRKLQAEIDEVREKSSGEVSYEDLHAMKYLDAVVSETLRMFSPPVGLDRVGPASFTLPPALPGLEPLVIKPGQNIWMPSYSFHHDPKYFPEPEKFDPERFSKENNSKINPLTYFPFGVGPRICIAKNLALMKIKLVLFHLFSKCDVLPVSKTASQSELKRSSFTMMPGNGLWLKIEPRQ